MAMVTAATATATVFFLTVPVPIAMRSPTATAAATHLMSTTSALTMTNFPSSTVHGIEHVHCYNVMQAMHLVINAVLPQSADDWPSFPLSNPRPFAFVFSIYEQQYMVLYRCIVIKCACHFVTLLEIGRAHV